MPKLKPHKKPGFLCAPTHEKQPKAVARESSFHLRPAWRVSRMEMVDPFGWHLIGGDKLHEVRNKLGQFESMTWNDILVKASKSNHMVPVDKVCGDARRRLMELGLDDTDTLLSLRLSAVERVWGILDENVLLVLWWDPFHLVYPTEPRNT